MIDRKTTEPPTDKAVDNANESLAEALRQRYQDVKNEKIPDRLQRLIDALKEAERAPRKDD